MGTITGTLSQLGTRKYNYEAKISQLETLKLLEVLVYFLNTRI